MNDQLVKTREVHPNQLTIDHFSLKLMWRMVKRKYDTVVPIMVNGVENVIYYVTEKQLGKIIDKPNDSYRRRYLTSEKSIWIAVDNTTGDAWTEEFDTFVEAASWLVLDHMSADAIRKVGRSER